MYLEIESQKIQSHLPPGMEVAEHVKPLFLIYALLLRSKGSEVTASDIHDAWAVWAASRNPAHACLVPYEELNDEEKAKDNPFLDAVLKAAADNKIS